MRVQGVFHRFGESSPLLRIDSFDFAWVGEASLFAASGTGKTSLFRLLAGWFELGVDSKCTWEPELDPYCELRFVGGHKSLMPWKSVYQNIRFHHPTVSAKEAAELLADVGLSSDALSLFPYELSFGMYKRVETVIAVLAEPQILLLDEFYSSFGDEQKEQIRDFVVQRRQGLLTWTIAHESSLRQWIGGPQYEFEMDGRTVVGIRVR